MTKLKTAAFTCMAVSGLAGWALAQDGLTTSTLSTPSAGSASTVSAPRTGLYTGVTQGNAAADNTVDDFSRRPTLIGDKQYFAGYGGADLQSAAYNFRLGSLNWFGAVSAGAGTTPATLRVGAGSGTSWGGGLLLAADRVHTKTAAGAENTTYYDASGIGAFGDFNLGSSDVYGAIGFNTGLPTVGGAETTVISKAVGGPEITISNHTLGVMAGWKKDATSEGTHAFNIEATYQMEMSSNDTPPTDVDATITVLTIMPAWGYILKANSDYSVFLGANSTDSYSAFEQGNAYSLALSPNIAFQKQLGKGFEGFSGFSVTGSWTASSDVPADGAEASNLLTGGADVTVGLRWVKDNLAFEGSLKDAVLSNGPYLIGGNAGQGLFLNIGLALGI